MGIIYAEAAENRLKKMLDRLKREGESYFFNLEEGAGMDEIVDLGAKMFMVEGKRLDTMREFVKTFGPKAEDSTRITRDKVERLIDEHLATMESKWKESGWSEEEISKETEKARERLWKQWEPFLK